MRATLLAFVGLLCLQACGGTSLPTLGGTTPPLAAAPPSNFADPFRGYINTERANNSLGALAQDTQLAQAAQGHATDMSINGYFSHTSQDGRTLGNRVLATGYRYCWAGENIAQGQASQAAVFTAWMNSSGHRDNMLSSQPTEFGFAHAPGNYWVLVLARPGC